MKEKIFKNFSLKLLSAVFAVVLWTVIVNIYDPNTSYTFSNITVQLINTQSLTDKDYSYEVVDGGKISVTVSGPKSVVTDLKTSDISATADLSKVTAFTDYVDIQVQVIKDGQVLNNVEAVPRTSALKLSIENRDTKTLSLDVNTTGSTASGYTVASTSSSPTYIKVTGPTSLLESVAALSVNVDVSGAKEDISTSADVKMLDEDGNEIVNDALELSCTKADINVDIARMKTVSITAKTSGTPADGYIITDTILSQASAVITGSDDLLGKVDTITIPSQNINADGLSADKTYTFRLSDYVTSGIKFVSDSSLTVTVKIAQKATKQISLSASEITLNNIQTGFNAQVMQGITFTVTGNDNVLSAVSASDVKAGIDLKNLGAGTHNVTVALSLPDGITVVGNVTVTVTITAIQQETTTESTKATESTTSATR